MGNFFMGFSEWVFVDVTGTGFDALNRHRGVMAYRPCSPEIGGPHRQWISPFKADRGDLDIHDDCSDQGVSPTNFSQGDRGFF